MPEADIAASFPSQMEYHTALQAMGRSTASELPAAASRRRQAEEHRAEREFRRLAAQQQFRRCPRCSALIQKTGCCSNMRCRCGHRFRWQTAPLAAVDHVLQLKRYAVAGFSLLVLLPATLGGTLFLATPVVIATTVVTVIVFFPTRAPWCCNCLCWMFNAKEVQRKGRCCCHSCCPNLQGASRATMARSRVAT